MADRREAATATEAWEWKQEAEQNPGAVDDRMRQLAVEHVDTLLGSLLDKDRDAGKDVEYYGQFGYDQPTPQLWAEIPDQLETAIGASDNAAGLYVELLDLRDAILAGTVGDDVVRWHVDQRLDQLAAAQQPEE